MLTDGHHHLAGIPSRHLRTLAIAGILLTLLVLVRSSSLFRAHYESGFSIVNPSKTKHLTDGASPDGDADDDEIIKGDPPVALPGDEFYIADALHHSLHPPPPPPPPPREFPDHVAVLMETDVARVPNLVPVTLHFANLLGPRWPVVILTLKSTWVEPASPPFKRLMAERRIRIHFLPDDTVFPDHTSVSLFLTQPWFWEQFVSADRLLLFQADSILCANSATHMDDFVEWDLIGAPIAAQYGVGYNGGLSLRNPKLMLDVTRDPAINTFAADLRAAAAAESWQKFEDQWFYHTLATHRPEAKLPSPEVAKTFSVETTWFEKPLGYHQPFRWLTDEQKKMARAYCPEIALLEDGSHFF